jgi:histone-lysine N-methyltransferase SETMAR
MESEKIEIRFLLRHYWKQHLSAVSAARLIREVERVPHELTPNQAKPRVEICRQLLDNPLSSYFFNRIVTSDEKCIYFYNPDKQGQWLDPNQPAQAVAKCSRFEEKVMLCVWWNCQGIIHFELVPSGRTITANLYCQQLGRMYEKLAELHPGYLNRGGVHLLHDNAKPHTAKKTKNKIEALKGIELLPHPAYSPDLAPSDYYLFRSMAHLLRGRRFKNVAEVESGVQEFFKSKDKSWYRRGIHELAERWVKTIEHDGLYFET